jgi:hypothetical protein
MNPEGQALASKELEKLRANGGTNIWAGLSHGLDVLSAGLEKCRLGHIMLLTDGQSQGRDSILPNLDQYRTSHGKLPGTISTFGFGYGVDSRILVDLATHGSGSYSFIPDAGFVGTVFIHTLSNLLVTMAHEVYLDVKSCMGSSAQIVDSEICISGGFPVTKSGRGVRVSLGTLQLGQSRDIIIPVKSMDGADPCIEASLSYAAPVDSADTVTVYPVPCNSKDRELGLLVEQHACRVKLAEAISRSVALASANRLDDARGAMQDVITHVKASPCDVDVVQALLEDICGQCTEALSRKDWFDKWGIHYLPSIMFAHRLQLCNNFKDPGVQHYGGKLFSEIRDVADDVFNSLPAPTPSRTQSANHIVPVNMSAYNNCYGG